MIRRWLAGLGQAALLRVRVNRRLWLEALLAASSASALMALVAGLLVLSQSATLLRRQADDQQAQLSLGLTSYEPLHDLQRRLQQATSRRALRSALVIDQRGLVLAASDNALVGQPLPRLLQLPGQQVLRELFAECPSSSTLLPCLTRQEVLFHGPVPWIGGDVLVTMQPYPLALEGRQGRLGDRATLITVTDVQSAAQEALLFMVQVFLAGLLPLIAACGVLLVRLRSRLIPELLQLAQIDPLSGVYNRRAFMETASALLGRAEAAGLPMALALIDVDYFKQINDTYGHDVGDRAIKAVSELLHASVRSTDLVGRLGGDEFVILVQLSSEVATQMLERTRQLIVSTALPTDAGDDLKLSISVGVATSSGQAGYSLLELMSAADAALYVAKDRGRAQVVNLELELNSPRQDSQTSGYWQIRGA